MRRSSVGRQRSSFLPVGLERLEQRTLFAAIVGTVFNDLNGDGLRQDGEGGLSNWRVYIDANANNAFDEGERSALTNGDGRYVINELAAGTYRVREVVKEGFTRTAPGGNGTHEITLGADGEEDAHFGNRAEEAAEGATLFGQVFNDQNGDGLRQDGEGGLSNRTVYLDQNNNGKRDDGERAVITNAEGFYSFKELDGGTYRVRQVVPEGWELTVPEAGFYLVEVEAGQTEDGLRFGNREVEDTPPAEELASIRGFVFNDLNGNGTRQDGEPALSGWTVYLDQNNNGHRDEGERAATTNANGNYAFEELEPGTYRVREALPDGWTIVRPGDGFYVVSLEAGQAANERIFANRREEEPPPQDSGVLRGVVFNDVNGDGVWQDGEPGLGSRTVYLDQNNNGQRDEGEHAATTNANGGYAFEALPAGTYYIRHMLLSGWTLTAPASGVYTVELAAGQTVNELRFGNRHNEEPPPPGEHSASIRGVVFNDVNGDGNRSEGEPPLAGWIVYLDQNRNGHRDEGEHAAVTNAEGGYAFEELAAGDYRVREVVQEGWTVIRPESGFYDITLAAGQAANERVFANRHNAGEEPPAASASIRGVVFNDRNGNGTRQDGEAGLGGRLLFLDQNKNGHRDDGEHAAETNGDGRYAFEGLAAGSYRVVQVAPSGWTIIRPAEGFYDLDLLDGQRADDAHFANRHNEDGGSAGEPPAEHPEGEIVGEVFDDADADGIHDEGEAGVARARVFVDLNGNGRRDRREVRAVTDASGAYRLVGVPEGEHVVKHVAPKGFRSVALGEGDAVSVTAGGSAVVGGFAVTRKSLLQGTVFHDATGNRALDAGENGQAGLTMFLDLNRNNLADIGEPTALTDAAGRYAFLVDRGSYRLGAILPDGWQSTSARDGMFQVKVGSGRVVERDLASRPQ